MLGRGAGDAGVAAVLLQLVWMFLQPAQVVMWPTLMFPPGLQDPSAVPLWVFYT